MAVQVAWLLKSISSILCILICIFEPDTLNPVDGWESKPTSLELGSRGIRDEDIHDSAPLVRALVVERLEKIWRNCEPFIDGTGGKPDPRFIEAGIRVCDRLSKLYRLEQPVPGSDQPSGDLIPVADLVTRGLEELEARMADGSL